jgi:hypothetical protein
MESVPIYVSMHSHSDQCNYSQHDIPAVGPRGLPFKLMQDVPNRKLANAMLKNNLQIYLHSPHSAKKEQLFLHFIRLLYEVKKNALCEDHVYRPVLPSVKHHHRLKRSRIFMKFGRGITFLQTLSRKREFCKNWFCESHTTLKEVLEFLAVLNILLHRSG